MSFAVVLVGGAQPGQHLLDGVRDAELVVAADGGVRIARTHGLPIHYVVGDLDSASADDIEWARSNGADIDEFSRDKNETDLELALDHADGSGVDRIVAIGVDGGRLDHELGNWLALGARRSARVEVRTNGGNATILHAETHPAMSIKGSLGNIVSLLPRFGDAVGVTTSGLRWELDDATLHAASTRGISNEMIGASATVSISGGTLVVVRPSENALANTAD